MRLLIDSHSLLWFLAGDERLPAPAREAIEAPDTQPFVSASTIWELEIKRKLGRLELPPDLLDVLERGGFELLAVTAPHAEWAGRLPLIHHDPFDRMLVAQAQAEGLTVLTADREIPRYRVQVLDTGGSGQGSRGS